MKRETMLWKGWRALCAALLLLAVVVASGAGASYRAEGGGFGKGVAAPREKKAEASPPKTSKIDLSKAVDVNLPANLPALKPAAFRTADGKEGWVVKIPGDRPLATPAYSDGLLFVGGGYGSHEFYAFDARTGALAWQTKTSDDGPSAAVAEDGYVAFNTESCTLIVVEEKTGKLVWQEWLGDPLMSQPAISKGRVFMAYPSNGRKAGANLNQHVVKPHAQQSAALQPKLNVLPKPQQSEAPQPGGGGAQVVEEEAGSHRLLCADLKTGRHIWERAISGDVISAPVVNEGKVFFTTFDGTSYSLDAGDGRLLWKKENAGTSAPIIAGGEVVITQKVTTNGDAHEGLKVLSTKAGTDRDDRLLAREKAGYLGENKGGGVALKEEATAALDSSVGFGNAPAAAQLDRANQHLGVKTVVGGWAYQGSRAAYSRGRMLNAQGKYLNSINAASGDFAWRAEVSGGGITQDAQVFSPPALGDQFMYLSSALGHLLSVRQSDGEVGFAYSFKQPMVFQPALAGGSVFVGTSNGLLICLKTGSADADGWHAWGGNAEHNKNK
jgi:Ca-activated chloride channel family protein